MPPPARNIAGGPKLARAILLTVLSSYVAAQAIDTWISPLPARHIDLTIEFAALAVLFVLTVWVTSPTSEYWPAWLRLVVLLAEALFTYLPLAVLLGEWPGMAGFFAGSALLLLTGALAWLMFATAIASTLVIPLVTHVGPYATVYLTLSTVILSLVVFGLGGLSSVTRYIQATRGELAQLAVMNERVRFARDLHDLLGFSLSAIALKAELIRRVVGTNPGRARDELAEVLDITRQALADTRLVARGYRNISLAREASSVAALLKVAGINAHVEISTGVLEEAVDTVLATVLREAVTNVLRHSAAQNCSIEAYQVGEDVWLRVLNDGVPRWPVTVGHQGGLDNLTARLQSVGGRISVKVHDGQFDLLAEAPNPEVPCSR